MPALRAFTSSWQVLHAGTTVLVALVFGFVRLGDVPLDARFWIVSGSITLLFIAVLIAVWQNVPHQRFGVFSVALVLVISSIALGAVGVLEFLTRYHTLRIIPSPVHGEITIEPPRTPVVAFRINFSSTSQSTRLVRLEAKTLAPEHLPAYPEVIDGEQVYVSRLRYPQLIGVSYGLSGSGTLGYHVASIEPADVPVLTAEQIWSLRRKFAWFAATLWLIGAALWCVRWSSR